MRLLLSAVASTFLGPLSLADEEDQAPANDSAGVEEVEEIIVYGGRPGNPIDIDTKYEENLRDQLLKDLDRLRILEEENEWRSTGTTTVNNPSRIKWGYDPGDEIRMRRDTSLTDLPIDDTKPATIFSIEF